MHDLSRWVDEWMLRNGRLPQIPVREAYQFSLRLEEAVAELYTTFSEVFAANLRVAEHWRCMAEEEWQHHQALCVAYALNDARQTLESRFDWAGLQRVVGVIEAAVRVRNHPGRRGGFRVRQAKLDPQCGGFGVP